MTKNITENARTPAMLTVLDLADMFRTTENGIYAMNHRGHLPPSYKVGRRRLWRRADIDAWLEAQRGADQASA